MHVIDTYSAVIRLVNIFTLFGVPCTSYSTIVLYSKDHKGVGMAHEITLPKNQPQSSLTTMKQYWLGKTKPKQAFRLTWNTFSKLLRIFFFFNYLTECSSD